MAKKPTKFEDEEFVETAPEKPSVPPPAEASDPAGEPAGAVAGSHTVIIEGTGTTPIQGEDGAVRTVDRGVPIEVSDAELAYLDEANLPYEETKKGKK